MMSYLNSFVVSVIHNDKPLRELGVDGKRTVRVPFGAEYKIRIKSKYHMRALVSVTIDGTDVIMGGRKLVMQPYGSVDLERFVDGLDGGRKFKFISIEEGSRTGQIQDPTSPENGLIKVTIEKESDLPIFGGTILRGGCFYNSQQNDVVYGAVCSSAGSFTSTNSDKGATVEGSHSDQKFYDSNEWFQTEAPFSIDIWMKGSSVAEDKKPMYRVRFFNTREGDPYIVSMNGVTMQKVKSLKIDGQNLEIEGQGFNIKTQDFELAYDKG